MELGDKIRAARKAKGWSQTALAKRVGVTQPAIKKIEAGQTERSRYLSAVLAVLGLPPLEAPSPRLEPIPPQGTEDRALTARRRRALEVLFAEALRRATGAQSHLNLEDATDRKALAEVLAGLATAPLIPETILGDETATNSHVETAFHFLDRPELDQ